jgi:hypothetical protein
LADLVERSSSAEIEQGTLAWDDAQLTYDRAITIAKGEK